MRQSDIDHGSPAIIGIQVNTSSDGGVSVYTWDEHGVWIGTEDEWYEFTETAKFVDCAVSRVAGTIEYIRVPYSAPPVRVEDTKTIVKNVLFAYKRVIDTLTRAAADDTEPHVFDEVVDSIHGIVYGIQAVEILSGKRAPELETVRTHAMATLQELFAEINDN